MPLSGRGNGNAASRDTLFSVYRLLLTKLAFLETISNNTGGTVGNTQTIENLLSTQNNILNNLLTQATEINNNLEFEIWDKIAGNSIEFVYYTGVAAGNPSGNTGNLRLMLYKQGASTVRTLTYTYSLDDKIVSIVTS